MGSFQTRSIFENRPYNLFGPNSATLIFSLSGWIRNPRTSSLAHHTSTLFLPVTLLHHNHSVLSGGTKMASSKPTVLQSSTSVTARVHPLVIFNICDCFVRRSDRQDRVIGTLLGSVLPDGTVDIRNSYAVPHDECSGQVPLRWFSFSILICLIRLLFDFNTRFLV